MASLVSFRSIHDIPHQQLAFLSFSDFLFAGFSTAPSCAVLGFLPSSLLDTSLLYQKMNFLILQASSTQSAFFCPCGEASSSLSNASLCSFCYQFKLNITETKFYQFLNPLPNLLSLPLKTEQNTVLPVTHPRPGVSFLTQLPISYIQTVFQTLIFLIGFPQ